MFKRIISLLAVSALAAAPLLWGIASPAAAADTNTSTFSFLSNSTWGKSLSAEQRSWLQHVAAGSYPSSAQIVAQNGFRNCLKFLPVATLTKLGCPGYWTATSGGTWVDMNDMLGFMQDPKNSASLARERLAYEYPYVTRGATTTAAKTGRVASAMTFDPGTLNGVATDMLKKSGQTARGASEVGAAVRSGGLWGSAKAVISKSGAVLTKTVAGATNALMAQQIGTFVGHGIMSAFMDDDGVVCSTTGDDFFGGVARYFSGADCSSTGVTNPNADQTPHISGTLGGMTYSIQDVSPMSSGGAVVCYSASGTATVQGTNNGGSQIVNGTKRTLNVVLFPTNAPTFSGITQSNAWSYGYFFLDDQWYVTAALSFKFIDPSYVTAWCQLNGKSRPGLNYSTTVQGLSTTSLVPSKVIEFTVDTSSHDAPTLDEQFGISKDSPDRNWQTCVTYQDGTQACSTDPNAFNESDSDISAPAASDLDTSKPIQNIVINELTNGASSPLATITPDQDYKDFASQFPSCLDGSCVLDLVQKASQKSCYNDGTACSAWFEDSSRDTEYECQYGGIAIPLSGCAALQNAFKATTALDGKTITDPDTETDPKGMTQPGKALDQVETSKQETDDGSSCWTDPWENVHDPLHFVFVPVKCALVWAFKPSPEQSATLTDGVAAAVVAIPIAAQLHSIGDQLTSDIDPQGCTGLKLDLSAINSKIGTYNLLASCEGDALYHPRQIVYVLACISVLWLTVMSALKHVAGIIGYGSPTVQDDGSKS